MKFDGLRKLITSVFGIIGLTIVSLNPEADLNTIIYGIISISIGHNVIQGILDRGKKS